MRIPLLASCAGLLVISATADPSLAESAYTASISYQGRAVDEGGQPLEGVHELELRYFGMDGRELLAERHPGVRAEAGRFEVELGRGAIAAESELESLQAVFAANPANSTFTQTAVITPAQGLADFNWTVCGFFVIACLPQPDVIYAIDSLSWWPMQRLQYRNFGDYETLVGSWTVDLNPTGEPNHAGIRWFELRRGKAGKGPWTLHQQGTWAPDADHRFFPSAAMDESGNIAVGYSVTSATTYPGIRYATRSAGDPPGTLQPEATLFEGLGSQTFSNRWGDYSSMEVDPADDCTFWYTNQYQPETGSFNWVTRIGTFKHPDCETLHFADGFEDLPPGKAESAEP